jgi:plastocyanin
MSTVAAAPSSTAPRARLPHAGTASFGWLLVAVGPLLLIIGVLASGGSFDDLPFLAGVAAVALIAAGVARRFGLGGTIGGLVLGVLASGAVFWLAFGLAAPASVLDFVPGVTLVLGVLLGVGGSIAAIVGRRRSAEDAPPQERRLVTGATALVALAAVVSGGLWLASREQVEASAAEGAVLVSMSDFTFGAETIEIAAGERFLVRNDDPFFHTFTVPELGIDEKVLPGSEVLIEVEGTTGEYLLYCIPHSQGEDSDPAGDDMAATIVVN